MYIIVLLDATTNVFIGMIYQDDESTLKIGDIYEYNSDKYNIISIDTEEVLEYELVVYKIKLSKCEVTDNEDYLS